MSAENRTVPEQLFGDAVRVGRRRRGWTQQQLADAIGLHRVTIGQLEIGNYGTSLATAFDLADALDINLDDVRLAAALLRSDPDA